MERVRINEDQDAAARAAYDEDGVDRSLIRWMLGLTPTERLRVAEEAIALIESARILPSGPR